MHDRYAGCFGRRVMRQPVPSITEYMTPSPHSIGAEQSLAKAQTMMRDLGVRHLPVLHGGILVGLVSDRDLHLVEALKDVNPRLITVSDAMATTVYAVPPDAPLDEVARTMAETKYGAAVVVKDRAVIGIFTTVDACHALAELLRTS